MGLGISLALLIYLFTNAMDSQSSGGKPSGGGYGDNYRSIVKVCIACFAKVVTRNIENHQNILPC